MADAPLKHIFIIGCRRSGTTWVTWLLSQHPELTVIQHCGFLLDLLPLEKWWMRKTPHGRNILPPPGVHWETDGRPGLIAQTILTPDVYYDGQRPFVLDVYRRLAAANPRARGVVDHTPENLQCWRAILQFIPDAYFLHVRRDPREVYVSQREAAHSWGRLSNFGGDALAIMREWTRDVRAGRAVGEATERYHEVDYRDLQTQGPAELQRIFDWLEMPVDAAFCAQAIETCRIDNLRERHGGPAGFYRKGVSGGWQAEMSVHEVRAVEYLAGELMEQLHYTRSLPRAARAPWPVAVEQMRQNFWGKLRRTLQVPR